MLLNWRDNCNLLCREDSDPRFINNSADVKLRSFTTKVSLIGLIFNHLHANSLHIILHLLVLNASAVRSVQGTRADLASIILDLQVHKVDALVSYKAEAEEVC